MDARELKQYERFKSEVQFLRGHAHQTSDQTRVSDFYRVYDHFNSLQQKCLTHLLRELKETVTKRSELAGRAFIITCKRLTQSMLKLKTHQATSMRCVRHLRTWVVSCKLRTFDQQLSAGSPAAHAAA